MPKSVESKICFSAFVTNIFAVVRYKVLQFRFYNMTFGIFWYKQFLTSRRFHKKFAKFYFNSTNAHTTYPDKKVTKADAVVAHMGSLEMSNERNINKMIVNQVLPTCQLQMGMTELAPGSVWNTMPAHTHSRRMEAYFYFEVPEEQAVCHFMGQIDETRHIWMKGDQAVLSPEWSIHSAAATHNYTFIWGMGGENLDYGDQDFSKITDLK